jgi:acyl-CoA thioesterase
VTDEQALAESVARGMLERDAFSRWLGIELVAIAPRQCTVRMTVRDEMVNGFGVSHGGIAYALADSALAFAANSHGMVTVAIENTISYPAAVHAGDVLTAVAEENAAASRLAFFGVTVRNQTHAIVALFQGTVYRTKQHHAPHPNPND